MKRPIHLSIGLILSVAVLTAFAETEFTAEQKKDWAGVQAAIEFLNSPQVTTDDVIQVLEIKGTFSDSKTLTTYIGERAADNRPMTFSMTERDVSRLKHAGATPELITAMRSPKSVVRAPEVLGPGGSNTNANSVRFAANQTAATSSGSSSSGGQTNVELILDASGSMAAKIQGRTKMEIAKQALTELLLSIPSTTNVAVRAYGHRKKDDCSDIELIANFGEARSGIPARVNALKPLGKTPLSGSINASAKDFVGKEGQENTVILITDGEETCNADPCAAAKVAHESGIKVKINVIGFKIEAKERAQLECIANAGGGKYVSANDASELTAATKQVAQVAAAPPPPPTPTPTPARFNLLATENGGQLMVAPADTWAQLIDGKEDMVSWFYKEQEAVYAFKDEKPATFSTFTTLVPGSGQNVKEIELLVANDSPTGDFKSIGKFTVQNAKLVKTPYQEFNFPEVTAKYLKVKLLNTYTDGVRLYEFQLFGKPAAEGAVAEATPSTKPSSNMANLLSSENGGQLLMSPADTWAQLIDGKEDMVSWFYKDQEAVFGFKDEKPATFSKFTTLVPGTGQNVKEIELLAGNDGPTGDFKSIGKFTVQNAKLFKTPYQEFTFPEVTAKYLKVKIVGTYTDGVRLYEFQLFGKPAAEGEGTTETTSSSSSTTSAKPANEGTNLLASENGGQILVSPADTWAQLIDGKEDMVSWFYKDQEAVFGFKDEKSATFSKFTTLVPGTGQNVKEIELFVGNDSPTGDFKSIGKFTVQNAKLSKTPYQPFNFPEVTAKYLKVKLSDTYTDGVRLYEFQLWGKPAQ